MIITLKDGSKKEYAQAMSIIDIARDISEGLARVACVGEVDGQTEDLRTVIDKDCELNILTAKDAEGSCGTASYRKPCYGTGYQETVSERKACDRSVYCRRILL